MDACKQGFPARAGTSTPRYISEPSDGDNKHPGRSQMCKRLPWLRTCRMNKPRGHSTFPFVKHNRPYEFPSRLSSQIALVRTHREVHAFLTCFPMLTARFFSLLLCQGSAKRRHIPYCLDLDMTILDLKSIRCCHRVREHGQRAILRRDERGMRTLDQFSMAREVGRSFSSGSSPSPRLRAYMIFDIPPNQPHQPILTNTPKLIPLPSNHHHKYPT